MDFKKKLTEKIAYIKHEASRKELRLLVDISLIQKPTLVQYYSWPYPHAIIDNYLASEGLEQIETFFQECQGHSANGFQYGAIYDLFFRPVEQKECAAIDAISYSFKTLEFIEQLFGMTLSRFTTVTFHDNKPRKEDKYVHSDAVQVVFRNQNGSGLCGPALQGSSVQHFLKDNPLPLPAEFIALQRSATTILYLSRDWKPGDGGETGIFSLQNGVDIKCARIEPKFNRLLIMQNTPRARHNYLACSLPNRKSLIQWFHS